MERGIAQHEGRFGWMKNGKEQGAVDRGCRRVAIGVADTEWIDTFGSGGDGRLRGWELVTVGIWCIR